MVRALLLAAVALAAIFLGSFQPAVAQTATMDPRWGLLAELAERDFHFEGWGGTKILQSYRWEEPGRRLSYFFSYVGSDRQVMTLDETTGEILLSGAGTYAKYGDKYATRLKAAADGTIVWPNGKPFLSRGEGDTYVDAVKGVMVETKPGDAASEKVQKLIAAGKLRAANPSLRGAVAPSSTLAAANLPSGSLPAMGVATKLTQIQRDALDRYVKAGVYSYNEGMNLRYAQWIQPGKSYVVRNLRESAGATEGRYELRPDGVIVLSDEARERAYGLIGQINPSTGQITVDYHDGAKLYRDTFDGVAGNPGAVLVVHYQGIQRKRGVQWTEYLRETGAAFTPAQIESFITQINAQIEMRKNPWGALAALPGKLWYCVGYEPQQWLMRRHMYQGQVGFLDESVPVMRVTVASWREPDRVLDVVTKLGDGRGWTDTITRQPDGTFSMVSSGVSQYANLRGQKMSDGSVVFPVANYNYQNGTVENRIIFDASYPGGMPAPRMHLNAFKDGYGDSTTCTMEPYDESRLPQWTADLKAEQQRIREQVIGHQQARQQFDQDEAEGQQMVAGMRAQLIGTILSGGGNGPVAYYPPSAPGPYGGGQGGNFLQDLQAMGEIAHREADRSKAQLDATIARAQAQPLGQSQTGSAPANSPTARPTTVSPTPPTTSTPSAVPRQPKTFRAFFQAYYALTGEEDHNTVCQSDIFTFTVPAWNVQTELHDWAAALEPMLPNFAAKCTAGGRKLDGKADYVVEDPPHDFQPRLIRNGDREVTMP
jgi:hypothetical protein